jgi:rfaE bifunctional protein nucleotidyltransferase chain/domain
LNPRGKIVKLNVLKRRLNEHRRRGKKIAFTNGCFDILHFGHTSYLAKAKKPGRVLVVGLNSDRSVKLLKGPSRPVYPQNIRAAVLAALECVDYVTIFDEETPFELIKSIKPDILIKGADWAGKEIAGGDIVKQNGGRVEFIKFEPGFSTTGLIKIIEERA